MAKKPTNLPDYTLSQALAVRALMDGTANEQQQKNALSFIINDLCDTFGLVYEPASFDLTAFRAGKAFVGQVLVGMTKPETIEYLRRNEK